MGPLRLRNSTRADKARSVKSFPKPRRKPTPHKSSTVADVLRDIESVRASGKKGGFDQRKAAAVLRALRCIRKSHSTQLDPISPPQAVREMRDGAPATALRHIRAGLQNARLASRVCADVLDVQRADLDWEVSLSLRHCVCSELSDQIKHINRVLAEAGAS